MTNADRERRLEELIAEFLGSQDAGIPLDRDALLAAHPELADDLRAFFREHDRIARLAAPLRASGASPSIETDATLGLGSPGASSSNATIDYDATHSGGTPPDATEVA